MTDLVEVARAHRVRSVVLLAAALALGVGVMVRLGQQPNYLLLIPSLVALGTTVVAITTHLPTASARHSWSAWARTTERPRGGDTRVGVLRRNLENAMDAEPRNGSLSGQGRLELHALLSSLADARLVRAHGITWATDPDQARQRLGPELAAYLSDPPDHPLDDRLLDLMIRALEDQE